MGFNGSMAFWRVSKALWPTTVVARYLPPWLTRAGLPPRQVRRVDVANLPLDKQLARELAIAGQRHQPVDLFLAPDLFLRKTVSLSAAARREFSAAVALQIRQAMPGQAAGLVWRPVQPVWRRSEPAQIAVYLIKETRLAELLRDAGPAVRRVLIDGVETAPLADNSRRADRPERFWNRATFALAAIALIAVLGLQESRYRSLNAQIAEAGAQVAGLRDTAAQTRAAAEMRNLEFAALLDEMNRFERESRPLDIIGDLTSALDDRVWLSSFLLDDTALRLVGFTGQDIAAVVSAIRDLDWVESVDLDGAVVIDVAGGERRFQLLVNIRDTVARQ
jgi:hypothetical protein